MASNESPKDLIGRTVGAYRIIERIGVGGMGEVYKAHDTKLDRPVALKLLSAALASQTDRLRRFQLEGRAASSLNHPNIVVVHDIGDLAGRPVIISEFVEGETLRERLVRGPLRLDDALHLVLQLTSALAAAHSRGIVHRDIKPENVMVRPDGYIKVLDFGLAKLMPSVDGSIATQTEPGVILGTPLYMSPEQVRGLETDPRTDVWSIGAVLYELLAGCPPFAGSSFADIVTAILHDHPPSLTVHAAHVPERVAAIVATALAKDPSLRYASAVELHRDLTSARTVLDSDSRDSVALPRLQSGRTTVGRDKERVELAAAFRRVSSGHGEVLSISGEPGTGKTTLVEDFLARLVSKRAVCRLGRGRCSERMAGTEAYLPVIEALDSLLHTGEAPDLVRRIALTAPTWYAQIATDVTGEGAPRTAPEPGAGSQARLKWEIAALMRELTRTQPLILFFDDVHWADASTIDLLAYLARRLAELRLLIIVTSRPSDLLLTNHPFQSLKVDLQAKRLCHEVTLDLLERGDVERYLALEFPGHAFPADLAGLIHAKTEGHPLFMADLVRYLATNGALVRRSDGQWAFEGSLHVIDKELPESIRAMIERKIAQLTENDRRLLTVASVQGYEFDSAVVAAVANEDAAEIESRLETLARVHRFVTFVNEHEYPDGTPSVRYRFSHVLYQNALYSQLRATRKIACAHAVADTLVRVYGARHEDNASELAALFETAHDYLRAAEYYRLAAQRATQLFASQEAAVLAARGAALLKSVPDSRERRERELALLVSLGNALISTRGYAADEVLETYARAHAICRQLGGTPLFPAVLYGIAGVFLVRGQHPRALEYTTELLTLTERQHDSTMIVGRRLMGQPLLAMGRFEEARMHLATASDLYDPLQHRALAYSYGLEPGMAARIFLAITLLRLGREHESLRYRDEALELGRQTPHANSECCSLLFAAMYDQLRGDRAHLLASAEAVLKLATDQGLPLWLAWGSILRGWAIADRGELEAGIAEMRRGLDGAKAIGARALRTYHLGLLAEQLVRAHRVEEAAAALNEADNLVIAHEERFWEVELADVRTRLAAAGK